MLFSMKFKFIYLLILLSSTSFGQMIKVNQERIERRIFELAKFGKDANGKGYRVAYTQGDIEGRAWFMGQMKKAGLAVTIDNAGNIIGKRQGKNSSLKPIAFGSHIDMVPDGGNYDGCVGSMAALEVIDVLNEHNMTTKHPLEVIIFSNEEGGPIGSIAMAGHLDVEGLKVVSQSGLTIAEGMKAIGGKPNDIKSMVRKKGDLTAFLELHIEQGGILDREKIQIGVVEGIVGIIDWEVTITGFANHAGTTPMALRHDAMLSAAKLTVAVNDIITGEEGKQVGTVGKITAYPGAYNVVPGKVVMGLEIRDLSYEKILRLFKKIEEKALMVSESTGTQISFVKKNAIKPAMADKSVQEVIEQSAKSLGLTYKYMPSGAGHDSQEMALICPIGMIFVPSKDGISHSPKEFTKGSDMANGANVLLQTILAIDKK
jgi:beta-ureidopropionase / N-carbamoyl-L-amino-acid hydrolase